MPCVESIKRSTDETSTERTVRFHDDLLKHEAFDDIASNDEKYEKSCALIPNGLVHRFLEGLTLGIRAYCRAGRLSRFHPEVDRGPIVQPGFPLLHRNSLPEGSSQSSIADRIIGIRLHCNFTVAQADVVKNKLDKRSEKEQKNTPTSTPTKGPNAPRGPGI